MFCKSELEKYLSACISSGADFAEIYEEKELTETISMLNGKVEDINSITTSGYGIRLYKGTQSFYAFSNDYDDAVVISLINDLKEAVGPGEQHSVNLEEIKYETRHPVRIMFTDTPLKEKTSLLMRTNNAAFSADKRIVKAQTNLLNVLQDVQISNSTGKLIKDRRVRTRLMCEAFAEEDGNLQSGADRPGAGMGLELYDKVQPEFIGAEAARVAIVNLSAKDCPSGKMPVIIDNGFGGVIFHEACGHSLEATSVAKNQSVFAGKHGTVIANKCISAVDDGTIPNAWGSQNIDDEGNFQQRRVLIKDGVLSSYMIDQLNSRRMGMDPTGSGRRQSYKFEPTSRMSNTFIVPGNDKFEDMFKGIKKGLYAKKMGGGSVNPQTGEFNFSVLEGYMIEDGQITYPVKGAALIGNGQDILFDIDMVADNLKLSQGMCGSISGAIPTDVGQPAIRITSITVGGTANG